MFSLITWIKCAYLCVMERKELRIGNYLLNDIEDIVEVYRIADDMINDDDSSDIWEPIPLTEEILLNNGFIKDEYPSGYDDKEGYVYCKDKFSIILIEGVFKKWNYVEGDEFYSSPEFDIDFVHDLQNAWLMFKKTELKIKL